MDKKRIRLLQLLNGSHPKINYHRTSKWITHPQADPDREKLERCVKCKSKMVLVYGWLGYFLGCMAYPKCEFSRELDRIPLSKPG